MLLVIIDNQWSGCNAKGCDKTSISDELGNEKMRATTKLKLHHLKNNISGKTEMRQEQLRKEAELQSLISVYN